MPILRRFYVSLFVLNALTSVVFGSVFTDIQASYRVNPNRPVVIVSVSDQMLYLVQNDEVMHKYPVSTSKYGIGAMRHSNMTPLGAHRVVKKIGAGAEKGTEFKSRRSTGRIAQNLINDPREDVITSRILWLSGLDHGKNLGGNVDSKDRYIYIHGTAQEGLIGSPASHGCIRMRNTDVIALFDVLQRNDLVYITAEAYDE
ncbi:MAG: L,D-transpeptidase [bacterium]|nr:L,D-transpeptidase [bacterium]